MIAVSLPPAGWQAWHTGRSPNRRTAAVNDWYDPSYPNGRNSSSNVEAHRCGSSPSRIRQYSTNGSIRSGTDLRRTPGWRTPSR
jgi:hypothetical protein